MNVCLDDSPPVTLTTIVAPSFIFTMPIIITTNNLYLPFAPLFYQTEELYLQKTNISDYDRNDLCINISETQTKLLWIIVFLYLFHKKKKTEQH